MSEEVIEAKVEGIRVHPEPIDLLLHTGSTHGVNWEMKATTSLTPKRLNMYVHFSWTFSWNELKRKGINGFKASISLSAHQYFGTLHPKMTENRRSFVKRAWVAGKAHTATVTLRLVPVRCFANYCPLRSVFKESDVSDVTLIVEGRRIFVNKGLLMVHSEFFQRMFLSDFREKTMTEIPLEDVDFEMFQRLLSIIHPMPEFPTDETSESLLELADRFMMPSVISHVENYLIRSTNLEFSKVLMLADRYKMTTLLEKFMARLRTPAHVKNVKYSWYFDEMSDSIKLRLLDLICKFS